MNEEQARAISKAASALRFSAANWEWLSGPAKEELIRVAAILSEIDTEQHTAARSIVEELAKISDDNVPWWLDDVHRRAVAHFSRDKGTE